MELKDFIGRLDSQTKVKIIQNDEVLFEGTGDILEKLLKAKVKKHGCASVDGSLVINVDEYV